MKKPHLAFAIALAVPVIFLLSRQDHAHLVSTKPTGRSPASVPQRQLPHPHEIQKVRSPAQEGEEPQPLPHLSFKKESEKREREIPSDLDPARYEGLGPQVFLSPKHRAVKTKDYAPSLGELVVERGGYSIFTPLAPEADSANVVYDKQTGRYYPLSSVLKVENIASTAREGLRDQGFQEYYYNSPVRLLFISSSHDRLFQDYRTLQSMGLKVSLEILRDPHRPR